MTTALAPLKMVAHTNDHGHTYEAVDLDGIRISFREKDFGDRRSWGAKARVYGAVDALVADLNEIEPKYIPRTDEDSTDVERVEEKMWLAWRDTTKKIAGQRLSALVSKLVEVGIEDVKFDLDDPAKVGFSYKAGCSCDYSPGFILDGVILQGWKRVDMFLSVARVRQLWLPGGAFACRAWSRSPVR